MPKTITDFFRHDLQAPLHNAVWSWGQSRPMETAKRFVCGPMITSGSTGHGGYQSTT